MKDKKSWTGIIFVSVSVYFCKKIIRLFPHFTLEHTPSPHGRQHHPQSVFQDCEVFKQKKKIKINKRASEIPVATQENVSEILDIRTDRPTDRRTE